MPEHQSDPGRPQPDSVDLGAESGAEATVSKQALQARLRAAEHLLNQPAGNPPPADRPRLLLECADTLLQLGDREQAWRRADEAFEAGLASGDRELMVEACERMFLSNEADSLAALGQGVWLAVTYPVDPALSVRMLRHIIDETPDDADGAAVAAAAAAYIVDLRATPLQHSDLCILTLEMLGRVAREHGEVHDQVGFDAWMKRLELDSPPKFLVRLRNVVDVLVQDSWRFDCDALLAELPEP